MVTPAPTSAPLNQPSIPEVWMRWFQGVFEFLNASNTVITKGNISYLKNGAQVHFMYYGPQAPISLPYVPNYDRKIAVFVDGSNEPTYINVSRGISSITLPAGFAFQISDYYFTAA